MALHRITAVLAGLFCFANSLAAQTPVANTGELLRVFLDCQTRGCDGDFFRTEITWVNFVRERTVADVHVLATSIGSGSGGDQITLTFLGEGIRRGKVDTLNVDTQPTQTQDEIRRALARALGVGLARFAWPTSAGDKLFVGYRGPTGSVVGAARGAKDRWNSWVFRVGANTFLNGDANYSSSDVSGSIRASRVTNAWKLQFSANGNYEENKFTLSNGRLVIYQHRLGASALIVKSLNDHVSAGFEGSLRKSTFLNQKMALHLSPAIEYDIYPYADATRRQVRMKYSAGPAAFRYDSTTLLGRDSETRPLHQVEVAAEIRQPWGSLSASVTGSQYLHDRSKRSAGVFGGVEWRVAKGLSLNLFGNYDAIQDQLYLPRGELTDDDVLARLRELRTSYRYFVQFGLSYSFGSIFNSVVNPRFGSGRGEGFSVFF